jgi:hypothetical protein
MRNVGEEGREEDKIDQTRRGMLGRNIRGENRR